MVKIAAVYEPLDIIQRALTIRDGGTTCPDGVGKHCPRCRLAKARSELDDEYAVGFSFGDAMLSVLCRGIVIPSGGWTEESSDLRLRELAELHASP